MKTEKLLAATMLGAIALATIDLKRGLPSPKRYVSIFVLWFVLGLVAQGSPESARAASRFSLLLLLGIAMAIAGKLTGFLDTVAKTFTLAPAPLQAGASDQSAPQPQGELA